jgi:hypothetical protein
VGEAEAMSTGGGAKVTTFKPRGSQRAQRNFILKVKGITIKIQEKDFGVWFLCSVLLTGCGKTPVRRNDDLRSKGTFSAPR